MTRRNWVKEHLETKRHYDETGDIRFALMEIGRSLGAPQQWAIDACIEFANEAKNNKFSVEATAIAIGFNHEQMPSWAKEKCKSIFDLSVKTSRRAILHVNGPDPDLDDFERLELAGKLDYEDEFASPTALMTKVLEIRDELKGKDSDDIIKRLVQTWLAEREEEQALDGGFNYRHLPAIEERYQKRKNARAEKKNQK